MTASGRAAVSVCCHPMPAAHASHKQQNSDVIHSHSPDRPEPEPSLRRAAPVIIVTGGLWIVHLTLPSIVFPLPPLTHPSANKTPLPRPSSTINLTICSSLWCSRHFVKSTSAIASHHEASLYPVHGHFGLHGRFRQQLVPWNEGW